MEWLSTAWNWIKRNVFRIKPKGVELEVDAPVDNSTDEDPEKANAKEVLNAAVGQEAQVVQESEVRTEQENKQTAEQKEAAERQAAERASQQETQEAEAVRVAAVNAQVEQSAPQAVAPTLQEDEPVIVEVPEEKVVSADDVNIAVDGGKPAESVDHRPASPTPSEASVASEAETVVDEKEAATPATPVKGADVAAPVNTGTVEENRASIVAKIEADRAAKQEALKGQLEVDDGELAAKLVARRAASEAQEPGRG